MGVDYVEFLENEVYSIDIVASTDEGKFSGCPYDCLSLVVTVTWLPTHQVHHLANAKWVGSNHIIYIDILYKTFNPQRQWTILRSRPGYRQPQIKKRKVVGRK